MAGGRSTLHVRTRPSNIAMKWKDMLRFWINSIIYALTMVRAGTMGRILEFFFRSVKKQLDFYGVSRVWSTRESVACVNCGDLSRRELG